MAKPKSPPTTLTHNPALEGGTPWGTCPHCRTMVLLRVYQHGVGWSVLACPQSPLDGYAHQCVGKE